MATKRWIFGPEDFPPETFTHQSLFATAPLVQYIHQPRLKSRIQRELIIQLFLFNFRFWVRFCRFEPLLLSDWSFPGCLSKIHINQSAFHFVYNFQLETWIIYLDIFYGYKEACIPSMHKTNVSIFLCLDSF